MPKTVLGTSRPLISLSVRRFEGGDLYRPGQANFCSSCGHRHWHVGRATCECGHCGAIVPLAQDRLDLICKGSNAGRLASWRAIARRLQELRGG